MAKFLRKSLALGATLLLFMGQSLVAFAADTTAPSDVEGVEAFPGDEEVTLSWDAATDDTDVTGYFIYTGLNSVSEDGGSYSLGSTDAGDELTYTMDTLTNGVTYYFAITAYDAEGNESEFYSLEVEATPQESETGDFTEPTVSDAEAITGTLVEVTFSEDITLPEENPESAFSIEASDGEALEVLDAYLSDDDNSVVFVVTDDQTPGAEYILTAGISIEDEAGNPIVSGTSDTGIFTGSSLDEPAEEEEDEEDEEPTEGEDFLLDDVESTSVTEITLTFTQEVSVAEADSFQIQLEDDAEEEVEVTLVEIDEDDASIVYLTTEEMEAGFDYVLTLDEAVLNTDGESITEDERSVDFVAKTLEIADLIAPEDVSNFLAGALNETTAELTWTASINTAGDLADYLIYESSDAGVTYSAAISVAESLTSFNYDGLTPGATYTFKVTAVDENGNESEGVLSTVTLPETGPGLIALAGLSLLGAGVARRKLKKNDLE